MTARSSMLVRHGDRLAHLQADQQGELVAVLLDQVREALQHPAPLGGRQPGPGAVVEGAAGGGDGAVDLVRTAVGDLGQDAAVTGGDQREHAALAGFVAAVDEVLYGWREPCGQGQPLGVGGWWHGTSRDYVWDQTIALVSGVRKVLTGHRVLASLFGAKRFGGFPDV